MNSATLDLKARASDLYRALCGPAAREDNLHEFYTVPWRTDRTPSLAVRKADGVWFDNARGDSGDVLTAVARRYDLDVKRDFAAVVSKAEELLGHSTRVRPGSMAPPPTAPPPAPKPRPIMPVPASASAVSLRHPKLGAPIQTWEYLSLTGELLFYVARWNTDPRKTYLPLAYFVNGWQWKCELEFYPLYGLPRLEDTTLPVILVEGEKAADAAQVLFPDFAVVSICGGAGRAARMDYTPLKGRTVYLWPDNDDEGRKGMDKAARALTEAGAEPRIVELPDGLPSKWDLADPCPSGLDPRITLLAAPATVNGKKSRLTPKPLTVIAATEYPEIIFPVENFLPTGLAILAAPPKAGKSFLALELLACIGTGRPFLGFKTRKGSGLYIDAEMSESMAKRRMASLGWPEGAEGGELFCPPIGWQLDAEGIAEVDAYVRSKPDMRVVIVDTMQRLVPAPEGRGMDAYQAGVARLGPLQAWAQSAGIAVVLVHHTGKGARAQKGGESYDLQTGSYGLTGTAETMLTISRIDKENYRMDVDSRHMEKLELAIRREKTRWVMLGDFEEATMGDERQDLLAYFRRYPGTGLREAATATGQSYETCKTNAARMTRQGLLIREGRGKYRANDCGSAVGENEPGEPAKERKDVDG